ncbi:MFS general substrate transporter [Aulographum hederae CBS 113979]|uniref:MFS general substrate transporter n=1 Tax=Aulographum hederae CBS 113979 TaxID=1176131 RepID=A0A6G1GHY2_9PEZI|nr:MFS general substrate transporter [Aulographum hederae CBS 113979]
MSETTIPSEPLQMEAESEKRPEGGELGRFRLIAISTSIIFCQLVQMIPYGAGISSSLHIGRDLGVSPVQATWIVAAYPLTQGAFVLVGGRVGTVYGHKNVVLVAGAWWVLFHLISGFMTTLESLAAMRAMSGIGGAFMVPNLIALLTITFPPGKMRNISVGLFGAMVSRNH